MYPKTRKSRVGHARAESPVVTVHTVSVGCADLRVLVRRRVGVQEAEHAEPGHVG